MKRKRYTEPQIVFALQQAELRPPDGAHEALDRAAEQPLLACVEAEAVVNVTADNERHVLGGGVGEIRVKEGLAEPPGLCKELPEGVLISRRRVVEGIRLELPGVGASRDADVLLRAHGLLNVGLPVALDGGVVEEQLQLLCAAGPLQHHE